MVLLRNAFSDVSQIAGIDKYSSKKTDLFVHTVLTVGLPP